MNSRDGAPTGKYDSFIDFYRDVYGHVVRESRPAGRTGATMLEGTQGAGDWSDAAVPDLVFSAAQSGLCRASIDLGAGRFTHRARWSGECIVIPPNSPTSIQMGGEHGIRVLAGSFQSIVLLDARRCAPSSTGR
jgi:AraC family transcriptional regulator